MMINPDQDYDVTFSYLTAFITFTRWLSRLVDFLSCPSAATFVDAIAAAANDDDDGDVAAANFAVSAVTAI